jgi:hypothetical protein
VNAAFTVRMSATVSWLPSATVLLAILIPLIAACVYVKHTSRAAGSTATAVPTVRSGWHTAVIPAALALLMLAVVGYRFALTRGVHEAALASPPSGAIAVDDNGTPGLALSPDDTQVIFTGRGGEVLARRLWISAIGSTTASPVAGTEGATAPFWSPEGRFVGFFAGGQLKKIDLVSGGVRILADARESHGGAWTPGGVIIFSAGFGTPLQKVGSTGGRPEPATALDDSTPRTMHRWPHMLPDGEHFLFTEVGPTLGQGVLRLGSAGSTDSRRLTDEAYDGIFVRPGFVIFANEYLTRVRVQPFDLHRLSFFPWPVPAVLPVALASGFSHAAMAASARTIAFALPDPPRDSPEPAQRRWYDRDGRRLEDTTDPDRIWRVASPDGRFVATAVRPNDTGPWEIRLQPAPGGGGGRAIVTDLPDGTLPTSWSPDGSVLTVPGDTWDGGRRVVGFNRRPRNTPAALPRRGAGRAGSVLAGRPMDRVQRRPLDASPRVRRAVPANRREVDRVHRQRRAAALACRRPRVDLPRRGSIHRGCRRPHGRRLPHGVAATAVQRPCAARHRRQISVRPVP